MENANLAKETLVEASSFIKKVIVAIDGIAFNLLSGQEHLALNSFVEVVDGLEWLINVINLTKATQEELGLVFVNYVALINTMREMVEAFENNDYVLLGDLLNYEVKPVLEQWTKEFQKLEEGPTIS